MCFGIEGFLNEKKVEDFSIRESEGALRDVRGIAVAAFKPVEPGAVPSGEMSDGDAWIFFEFLKNQTRKTSYLIPNENGLVSRFPDVRCASKTAVELENKTFLHANRMGKGLYPHALIATQCPPAKALEQFWLGMWENPGLVVDLTTQRDYCNVDMDPYYPDEGQALDCKGIQVTCVKWDWDARTRVYELKRPGIEGGKLVTRYHFGAWPDTGAVEVKELQALVQTVEKLVPNTKESIWVHCRAGVGRTGTLIAALILKEQVGQGKITLENLKTKLGDLVLDLRSQRDAQVVQSPKQLKLLYEYGQSLFPQKPQLKN